VAKQRLIPVSDQRDATARLRWITLGDPDLAREARPGHYLLVRCDEPGGEARLLRRALFVAAAEPALGQVGLLYEPDEPGLAWLAHMRQGDQIDVIGPLGRPLAPSGRSLLLVGAGRGLPALLLLAREASARGDSVTLVAGAVHRDSLPPPFLLPSAIEYQSVVGLPVANVRLAGGGSSPSTLEGAIQWADQLFAALPREAIEPLRERVRAARLRWDRGFATALVEAPLVCGAGACGLCALELRRGARLPCVDGPAFDLKDLL
jgi:dihydroorotate dehydrogenase electron transfer subunit